MKRMNSYKASKMLLIVLSLFLIITLIMPNKIFGIATHKYGHGIIDNAEEFLNVYKPKNFNVVKKNELNNILKEAKKYIDSLKELDEKNINKIVPGPHTSEHKDDYYTLDKRDELVEDIQKNIIDKIEEVKSAEVEVPEEEKQAIQEEIQLELPNMDVDALKEKIKQIDSKLNWLRNYAPTNYVENGKTREELIAEYEYRRQEYYKDLSIKLTTENQEQISNNVITNSGDGIQVNPTNGENTDIPAITDPTQDPNSYKPSDTTSTKATTMAGNILGAINTVGVVVSVVAFALIGIRYMLGSVEERANYKETMVPYLIGAVLLFATTTIVNVLYKFASGINGI